MLHLAKSKVAIGWVATAVITASFLIFFETPRNAIGSSFSSFSSSLSSPSSSSARCPAHCPSDPFSQAGMIHFGANFSDTRWVPFPRSPLLPTSLEEGVGALPEQRNLVDIQIQEVVEDDVLARAGPPYLRWLAQGELDKVEFMRDRSIVLIGSSHDRNNVEQLCGEAKGKYDSWGGHTGGICHIPQINLTISNWFTYGMVDTEEAFAEWKGKWESGPAVFSTRVQEIFLPRMEAANLSSTPDLVIMASLFWDDSLLNWNRAFTKVDENALAQHGWTFPEMTWHRSRVHSAILLIRELWGFNLPMMFRTRQIRKMDNYWELLKIFQLDQSCRAVAKELDVRLFTWGGKLEGFSEYYDGDQHFALGPSTYIFGDMLFFYLHRALTPGCWSCHQWDD